MGPLQLITDPSLLERLRTRLAAAGVVGCNAGGDIGEPGIISAECVELFKEKVAVLLAILGDEFFECTLLAKRAFLRGERRLEPHTRRLIFNPSGGAIVNAGMIFEIGHIGLMAARFE